MKRLLLFVFVMLFATLSWDGTCHATTSTPHIVIDGDVWLLSDSGDKLFLLPQTYYARINNLDEAYYYITFNGVSGKVSKNVVQTTGYHAIAKGTTAEINIDNSYFIFGTILLKSEPTLSSADVVEFPTTSTFTFIGTYPTADGIWYYVKYNQFYGYIKQELTTMPNIDTGTFSPELPPTDGTSPPSNDGKKGLLDGLEGRELRLIVIIGLAVPAILIIFLLFRPSKNRKYYD